MQQALVAGAGLLAKVFLILKIHVDGAEAHDRSGNLSRELQRNSFFRLNVQHQLVGHEVLDGRVAEQHKRRPPELYHDVSIAHRHPFTGAQIKGNVGPAPVVDQQLHGDKCFSARIGRNIRFGTVGWNALAVLSAFAVLAAYGAAEYFFVAHGLNGVQDFCLLVAHRVGVERNRRFHGGERDELHDMVGHHVAQRTGVIEVAAASFHSHRFRHRNLHVIDVAAIPYRLEDSIGKAKRHDVLDRLFAQVVIDAVDLGFFGYFQELLVERLRRFQVVAEGFLDHHPTPVAVLLLHQSSTGKLLHDGPKVARSSGQVVQEVLVRRVVLVNFGEEVFQLGIKLGVAEVPRKIVEAGNEPLPEFVVDAIPAVSLDVVKDSLAEVIVRHLGARHTHHGKLAGKQSRPGQVVERRNQHASRQIAGGAEDDHDAGIALLANARCSCCRLFRYL